jgi:hypothetical protein
MKELSHRKIANRCHIGRIAWRLFDKWREFSFDKVLLLITIHSWLPG